MSCEIVSAVLCEGSPLNLLTLAVATLLEHRRSHEAHSPCEERIVRV